MTTAAANITTFVPSLPIRLRTPCPLTLDVDIDIIIVPPEHVRGGACRLGASSTLIGVYPPDS